MKKHLNSNSNTPETEVFEVIRKLEIAKEKGLLTEEEFLRLSKALIREDVKKKVKIWT